MIYALSLPFHITVCWVRHSVSENIKIRKKNPVSSDDVIFKTIKYDAWLQLRACHCSIYCSKKHHMPNANCEISERNVTIASYKNIHDCELWMFSFQKIITTRKVFKTKFFTMQGDIFHRIKNPMEKIEEPVHPEFGN